MVLQELLNSPVFPVKRIRGENNYGETVWYGFTLPSKRDVKVGFVNSTIPNLQTMIEHYVGVDNPEYQTIFSLIIKEKLKKTNINVQQVGFYVPDENGNDSELVTGLGEASIIFQGVVESIRKDIEEQSPNVIVFASREPSRNKLYTSIANKMEKENLGWKVFKVQGPQVLSESDVMFICIDIESLKR